MTENKTLPFRAPPNVPIVGQAFELKGWYCTAMVQCKCGAHEPVLIVGQAVGECPACHKGYKVMTVTFDGNTGQANVSLAVVIRKELEPLS